MPGKVILLIFLLIGAKFNYAQDKLPVIKANSRSVTIRDGLHLKKEYWYIFPERKPDYYYVEIPAKKHTVSFITDVDSISFDVEYGREYDFIILLNNRDSCHTRIAARYKKNIAFAGRQLTDTIPFTIGNNSKIYFKGRINHSEPLNIQFDLGSGGTEIKKSSVDKVKMNFDGSVTIANSDGTNVVPYSTSNTLAIGNFKWDSVGIAVVDNMSSREDMIVGNSLFQNKVIEIDYDKRIIIIYDSLRPVTGYSRHDVILDGGVVPFIRGSLTINSKTKEGWFMFDTGAYTTILRTDEVSKANKLIGEARKMVRLDNKNLAPALTFGNYSFAGFNYSISGPDKDNRQLGLLGNDLLKRFNVILDNKNGFLYLKPNTLVNEPYANPEYYVVRVFSFVVILIIGVTVFIRYRRNRKFG